MNPHRTARNERAVRPAKPPVCAGVASSPSIAAGDGTGMSLRTSGLSRSLHYPKDEMITSAAIRVRAA